MTYIHDNFMYLTLLCVLCAFLYGRWIFAAVLCMCFLLYHDHRRTALYFLPLFILLSFPRYTDAEINMTTGKIIEVHQSYAIIANRNQKAMVYSEEPLPFDARVQIDHAYCEKIASMHGFYSFDFAGYLARKGVFYQLDASDITITEDGHSIRRILQKDIDETFADERKLFLNKLLLNLSGSEMEDSFLFQQGFSAVGFLLLMEGIMSRFLKEKQKNRISFLLCGMLCLIYHAPFSLLQHFIFRLVRFFPLQKKERFCTAVIIVLLLRPMDAWSVSFILPFLFRLSSVIRDIDSWTRSTLVLLYQSYAFGYMSPVQSYLFPYLMRYNGMCFLFALIQLLLPFIDLQFVFTLLDGFGDVLGSLQIEGSCLGIGLILYVLLFSWLVHISERRILICGFTILFQLSGLFHPCAEITFINVGQGDSILIREPFDRMNMLVDTGKPGQQERLYTFLTSKAISHIETLVITHDDNDHSGNREAVTEDFAVDNVITQHTDSFYSGDMLFYDLNRFDNEDENESSIVLYFALNRMKIMLMGDADRITEEDIVSRYGDLDCDILKLGHHGSATGSCDLFLDAVKPDLGIVSSGDFSIYHHPSPYTVKRLNERKIPWLDTKDEGDITILCFAGFNLLVTSMGKIAIIIP